MPALLDATRRDLLAGMGAAGLLLSVHPSALAQDAGELAAAVAQFAQGQAVRTGRVRLDVAKLVDNGNTVPLTVEVESPMTAADHVAEIAIFNEKNPQRDVARFTLGARAGKARVVTRIRLATSQKLVALARMNDGSVWSDTVDVVVVLSACIEGES